MSKKSKSVAAYVKMWNVSIFYNSTARVRELEQVVRAIVADLGGVAGLFAPTGVIDGQFYCVGRFPAREQVEQLDGLLSAAGLHINAPYIARMKGKGGAAVRKIVAARERAFLEIASKHGFNESDFDYEGAYEAAVEELLAAA